MNYDTNFVKLLSLDYDETVQCGGKKGDTVKIVQTGCSLGLRVTEINAYYYYNEFLKQVKGKW